MKAAIIGGGVIGGGWAARFLLNGWDVSVFDPAPQAERSVNAVLANARASLPQLYDRALPAEGRLRYVDSIGEAVTNADWIQESIPERLELKQKIFSAINASATKTTKTTKAALIGSSTSGFKPSDLNAKASANDLSVFVAHPFNPVYLLPLVELVGAPPEASECLTSLGMYPLAIRKEIDAHIADRLLEAVWREALWLVKDGVASTAEIDAAICMGFGLRWAQMGLFETYRIAGGEAGMHHFMEQFGPALQWPWTKLTDVPEFTDALVDLIAQQSDAQSGHQSIRELERSRDHNLVAILRALKAQTWGAGQVVAQHETQLPSPRLEQKDGQCITLRGQVLPSWIDYNKHMTEYRYAQVFSDASDVLIGALGIKPEHVSSSGSYFTVESHVNYHTELKPRACFYVITQILFYDARKLHLFHRLLDQNERTAATGEQYLLHIDHRSGKLCPAQPNVLKALAALDTTAGWPPEAGKLGGVAEKSQHDPRP